MKCTEIIHLAITYIEVRLSQTIQEQLLFLIFDNEKHGQFAGTGRTTANKGQGET
jgi:hypothetical protein